MDFPINPEEVKAVHEHPRRGRQAAYSCDCITVACPESTVPAWRCRNCGRVFSDDSAPTVK